MRPVPLDTSTLTRYRQADGGARRFRAEAREGLHGQNLAAATWFQLWDLLVVRSVLVGAAVSWIAAFALFGDEETGLVVLLLPPATFLGITVLLTAGSRDMFTRPLVQERRRLRAFAAVNGLDYRPEPDLGRLAADIFTYGQNRRHHDRFVVPGPGGFTISNYECTPAPDDPDSGVDHWGYVVFRLRESYPHTLVAGRRWPLGVPRTFKDADPIAGPRGTRMLCRKPDHPLLRRLLDSDVVGLSFVRGQSMSIEIVGNELFLLAGSFRLNSPRLWRRIETIGQALAPFLAEEQTGVDPDRARIAIVED